MEEMEVTTLLLLLLRLFHSLVSVSLPLSLALLYVLITYAIVVVLCGLVSVYRLVSLIDLMEN